MCVVLDENCDKSKSFILNPLTAIGMMATAKELGNHKTLVITAANCHVARCLFVLTQEQSMNLIQIVRNDKDVKDL